VRSRSPSPITEKKPDRSRSPLPITKQEQERSRSPSPTTKKDQKRSQSPSLTTEQKQDRSRSPSPITKQEEERSRSPSLDVNPKLDKNQSTPTTIEQIQNRGRSPSPITELKETQNLSSSSPLNENRERSRSPSPNIERKEAQSPSLVSSPLDERKGQSRSPSPKTDQKKERSLSSSPTHKDQGKDSFSVESPENKPDVTDNNGSLSRISGDHETGIPSPNKIVSSLSIDNHEEEQSNTLGSLKLEGNNTPRLSTDFNYDPPNQQRTSITNIKDKNEISPLPSPVFSTENNSSQPLKSPVHESIPPTMVENQITPIPLKHTEQESNSHSLKQRSTSDHQHESIPTSSIARRSSITRCKSQSTVARPNTLPFTPNNHDLDGLYTSNDYNDEDEILDDSEYHHNSAPSTVSIEQRRSSLLYNDNPEQQHTSIDPNDIFRRLSVVEKSRMEGTLYIFNNGGTFTVLGIDLFSYFSHPSPSLLFFREYRRFYIDHLFSSIHFFFSISR
jgi:hypothetical protein